MSALLSRAFDRAAAAEANAAIARVRTQEGEDGWEALSYEFVVPEQDADTALTEKLLPRLIYFLDCRGAKAPSFGGVFVTLFVGADIHFVRAADLIPTLAELSGVDVAELVRKYGASST